MKKPARTVPASLLVVSSVLNGLAAVAVALVVSSRSSVPASSAPPASPPVEASTPEPTRKQPEPTPTPRQILQRRPVTFEATRQPSGHWVAYFPDRGLFSVGDSTPYGVLLTIAPDAILARSYDGETLLVHPENTPQADREESRFPIAFASGL